MPISPPALSVLSTGKHGCSRRISETPASEGETESRAGSRVGYLITQTVLSADAYHLPSRDNTLGEMLLVIPISQKGKQGSEQLKVSPKSD